MSLTADLERELAEAQQIIRELQQELLQTNREVMALTLDLEHRVDACAVELRQSEVRYRLLADNTLDCIWLMDLDMNFTYVNPAISAMTGYTPSEWRGSNLREHADPAHFRQMTSIVEQAISKLPDETGIVFETEMLKKNGASIPVEITGKVLLDSQGMPAGLHGITRDITERRGAERALKAYSEQLEEMVEFRTWELQESNRRTAEALILNQTIIGASSLGITAYAASGACVLANASIGDILDAPREQVLAENFRGLDSWRDTGLLAAADAALITGETTRHEARLVLASGKEVWIECRCVPFRLGGEPHLLVLTDDITERIELQAQLVQQEKLAMLGRLAGGVSHELRNPLGAVRNAAYFLNLVIERPDPAVHEVLDIMKCEIDRAEKIIISLLDFARSAPPVRQAIQVPEVLRCVIDRLAIPDPIKLVVAIDEDFPPLLGADFGQMEQVFYNVMLNAIQAMPSGGQLTVTIRISRTATEAPDELIATISDTGTGFAPESVDRIFEPFYTTKVTGIGLGLPILKMLVEGHGGTIGVASKIGRGTEVTIKFPIGND